MEALNFKTLLEPYTEKMLRTVLRGGSGPYLKSASLPDCFDFNHINLIELCMCYVHSRLLR